MDKLLLDGMKYVATLTVPQLIETSVETYIKPKLQKYMNDKQFEKEHGEFEENISIYLEENYNQNLIMNTIVFQNEQKTINDLYIPLTLVKNDLKKENIFEEYTIDSYREDLISKYKKILVVDSAGMGKSTVIKYLYLMSITENKGIPILIELRKLDDNTSIVEYIVKQMNGIDYRFKIEEITRLISNGDFIFFLDGYDEIKQEFLSKITDNLQEFILRANRNIFFMASREETSLTTFGDFQRFDIKSLTQDEAYSLIKKYDSYGEISEELIEKLDNEENLQIIKEFLENPLMVSLLYKAFEYKKDIPYKKHIFYEQVYNALFNEHDLSKSGAFKREKRSNLDIEDFHRILRTIAFITLKKGIVYSQQEIYRIIKDAKGKNIGIEFKSSDFLYDITHSVPIFIKEGSDYKWVHKSFQEYFAANYIFMDSKDKQSDILKTISKGEKINKYYNVLDFYYDIDYTGFTRDILYPIISEMEKFNKGRFLDSGYKEYEKELLNCRKSLDYIYKETYFYRLTKEDKKIIKSDELINKIFENILGKGAKNFSSYIYNEDFCFIYERTYLPIILKLLRSKNSNLVYKVSDYLYITDNDMSFVDFGKKCLIDDDINNIVNDIDIYKKVIFHLSEASFHTKGTIFNYDKCIELKEKIEKDIEEEKNDIDYL